MAVSFDVALDYFSWRADFTGSVLLRADQDPRTLLTAVDDALEWMYRDEEASR